MFEKFFNKKESPEKVQAKIENLENQIHQEKMKLLNNEERIKAEMERVGGIDGLNEKIEKQKKIKEEWVLKTATNIGLTAVMCIILGNNPDASMGIKSLAVISTAINGANSIHAAETLIREWWKVKKSEMLKEEVEAATV